MNAIHVTGTAYENRQSKLWTLRKAKTAYVTFEREPKNPFDKNAIKVVAHVKGMRPFDIGYVPATDAKRIAPVMDDPKRRIWIERHETSLKMRTDGLWVNCNVTFRIIPNTKISGR